MARASPSDPRIRFHGKTVYRLFSRPETAPLKQARQTHAEMIRDQPCGSAKWVDRMASRLALQSRLRSRGRPKTSNSWDQADLEIRPFRISALSRGAAPCYARSELSLETGMMLSDRPSRPSRILPRRAPCPAIQSNVKANAVPVAASSSDVVSARPSRLGMRPRSATAFRIQHPAEVESPIDGTP